MSKLREQVEVIQERMNAAAEPHVLALRRLVQETMGDVADAVNAGRLDLLELAALASTIGEAKGGVDLLSRTFDLPSEAP